MRKMPPGLLSWLLTLFMSLSAVSNSVVVSCIKPLRVVNPHYRKLPEDVRQTMMRERSDYYVQAPCGRCALCRKKRANAWRLRLINEYMGSQNAYFFTLTFNDSNQHLAKDMVDLVRKWRQNYKYHVGVAPRYFLVEDKGTQYGRLHLHGILFEPTISVNKFVKTHHCFWPYGFVSANKVKSQKACSYVCGYISGAHASDVDNDGLPMKHGHTMCKEARLFIPKTYVSKGIGKKYASKLLFQSRYDNQGNMRIMPFYRVGDKCYMLPRYYQQLIFDDAERAQLKQKYLAEIDKTLYTFKDMPQLLRYVVQGKKLDEYGKAELFSQLISIYEDNGVFVDMSIQEQEEFDKSFIYELNLNYNL